MKIAHVVSVAPPDIGGMGQVAFDEAHVQAKHGHEATIYTLSYSHPYATALGALSLRVHRLHAFPRWGSAGVVPQLFFALKNADLIHLHYPFYGGAEWVYLASRFFHKPYILTYHMDAEPTTFLKRLAQFCYDRLWVERLLKGAARVIITDSQHFSSSRWQGKIAASKLRELSLGVDTDLFVHSSVAADTETDLADKLRGKHCLLFVGNFLAVKRLDMLLQAFAQVADSNLVLVIVGDGPDAARYRREAQSLGIAERVFFQGDCSDREKLARYYRCADAVVIPSAAESFSLVALEAMASGRPVIAADVLGLKGRITNGSDGFLFAPQSVETLAQTIGRFFSLSETARARMGETARQKVVAEYSLIKHSETLEEIYAEVAQEYGF